MLERLYAFTRSQGFPLLSEAGISSGGHRYGKTAAFAAKQPLLPPPPLPRICDTFLL